MTINNEIFVSVTESLALSKKLHLFQFRLRTFRRVILHLHAVVTA